MSLGTYEGLSTETFISGANLNGLLTRLVKLTATGAAVEVSAAAGDFSVGLLAHDPKRSQFDASDTTGDPVTVARLGGKIPLSCAGVVPAGDFVVAGAAGQIVAAGTSLAGIAAGVYVIGVAMEAGVAGQQITVLAQPFFSAA